MKRLVSEIKHWFIYYKKGVFLASTVYFISLLFGLILFRSEVIPISPTTLSFFRLWAHNGVVMLLILILGIVSFGILGNLVLVSNGLILGRILVGVYNGYGFSPIVKHILPHFIFETAAIVIAGAISYETYKFFYNIRHSDTRVIRLRYVCVGIVFVVILLSIGAFIESLL